MLMCFGLVDVFFLPFQAAISFIYLQNIQQNGSIFQTTKTAQQNGYLYQIFLPFVSMYVMDYMNHIVIDSYT